MLFYISGLACMRVACMRVACVHLDDGTQSLLWTITQITQNLSLLTGFSGAPPSGVPYSTWERKGNPGIGPLIYSTDVPPSKQQINLYEKLIYVLLCNKLNLVSKEGGEEIMYTTTCNSWRMLYRVQYLECLTFSVNQKILYRQFKWEFGS